MSQVALLVLGVGFGVPDSPASAGAGDLCVPESPASAEVGDLSVSRIALLVLGLVSWIALLVLVVGIGVLYSPASAGGLDLSVSLVALLVLGVWIYQCPW